MKKIKTEYLWYTLEEKNKEPSPLFTRELSKQVTKQLCPLLDQNLGIDPSRVLCFSINCIESYASLVYFDKLNEMELWISSLSAALRICKIKVRWYTCDNRKLCPWDTIQGEALTFELVIGKSQLFKLNSLLPEIYSPVIKAKESGLPYDYQIYYTSEGVMILSPKTVFSQEDIAAIDHLSKISFDQWNVSHKIKLSCIGPVKGTKAKIKIPIDCGGCPREAIEDLIFCFHTQQNIKRITYMDCGSSK